MTLLPSMQAYSSNSPTFAKADPSPNRLNRPPDDQPPRKPDWLLIMVSILLLVTVLVAWLAGVPVLGR
ncbi:MAG TPA: hypothetical protein VK404_17070 [Spirosoma sp.]|nr:hypothetical protein [Spirosoma sp.]